MYRPTMPESGAAREECLAAPLGLTGTPCGDAQVHTAVMILYSVSATICLLTIS
jgi:hypothetical protein